MPTEKELYTIKKLKTFKGMEGMGGFNLDLCRKGKKIAECINDDTGGDTMFYFINRDEEKIFDNYVKSLPPYEYDGETYSTDWNIYVENLVNAALEERLFKRLCKKYVCYELHGDKPGRYYSCLLYTSDAAVDLLCVDLGGRRIIKKKKTIINTTNSH